MDGTIAGWVEQIRQAGAEGAALEIRGGGSKRFYGQAPQGKLLDTRGYSGVVAYEPTELVITARSGTPLDELEAVLAEKGQFLAFEPPHFGAATIGGSVAAGLSGPRRQAVGAARDFLLGVQVIDGRGELLTFGGQVMKNVAGYDVARLMCGSLGTLAVLAEVSLKVLPQPVAEASLRFEMDQATALRRLNEWGGQPLPISASFWCQGVLTVRLSGARAAVEAASSRLGGEILEGGEGGALWLAVREQQHPFFAGETPLWRLSLPSDAPVLALAGEAAVEWGGAERWLCSAAAASEIRAAASAAGGHATLFRGGDKAAGVFQPLAGPLATIHKRLKQSFDPAAVFGRGRLYPDL